MSDREDDEQMFLDDFVHNLFAIIGACLEEGDDAEVTVNGMSVITFRVAPEEEEEEVIEEEVEQGNIVELANWKPTGEEN